MGLPNLPSWSHGCVPLSPSLLYFIQFGAFGSLIPFLTLILEDRELTKFQIGLIMALIPLMNSIAPPIGSFIFEQSKGNKIVWISMVLCAGSTIQLILTTTNFFALAIICSVWSIFISPVNSIANHAVLVHLGDRKHEYGKYRLWGAVSWGTIAFCMGLLLTKYSIYLVLPICLVGLLIYVLFISITIFPNTHDENKLFNEDSTTEIELEEIEAKENNEENNNLPFLPGEENVITGIDMETLNIEEKAKTKLQLLGAILNLKVLTFFFLVFCMGVGTAVIGSFLFIFIEYLGGSETLMGVSLVFTVLIEIPFFFFSGYFLKMFGEEWLILSAMLAYIVRVIGYSFLTNPWWVLPLELLHGLTFGAMYAAGINYSSRLFPHELAATGQGIFTGIYSGLGPLFGNVVGGYLYDAYGPKFMFRTLGVFIGCGALLLVLVFRAELVSAVFKFINSFKNPNPNPNPDIFEEPEIEISAE